MSDLFEPAFLERQQAVYPDLDVRVYAAAVREMHSRQPVRNPNGLLVHWLRRADKSRRARQAAASAADRAEQARYAAFWASLLELVALRQLGPHQVAVCLQTARGTDFPKLNADLAQLLWRMGKRWPGTVAAAVDRAAAGARRPGPSSTANGRG